MEKNKSISIIIPCRNEQDYIAICLQALSLQEYNKGSLEFLVIDGMSDDSTREIIKELQVKDPRIKLIDNPFKTTPQAMNIGLNAAAYDLIIRIDAHAKALPGFIEKNTEAVFESEDIMCAGGRIKNVYQNKTAEIIGFAMSSPFGVGNATFRIGGEKKFVDTLAFGIYKKDVFNKIGFFNESLIRNQDDELNFRLTKAGYKILYNPEIESEYFVRGSVKKLTKQYYQYGYWKVYVNKLHKTVTSIRQMVPILFLLGLIFGAIFSVLMPFFWMLYVAGILFYILLALVFAFKVSPNLLVAMKVSCIFPILHLSYGYGYLKGLLRFVILGQEPSIKSKELSRG
ncbi:glycosyltransferase family 2 protein [Crocinitomix catalasitica]|uniref:glycosyltransferase family 2 protein n=1 Tax=Crocinitomix catalasitica TaxID=184607 RepID=UPI0004898FBC|nr:glycosyltransferase family 2 protein [Crocinitomix catalasitica]